MRSSKTMALTLADRSKNIISSNWQGVLNTIKPDAKGRFGKEDIHSSIVKYLSRRGNPYVWVEENDLHNTNTILDERGSLSITSAISGPLLGLFKSLGKLPAHVAVTGDIIRVQDRKVQVASESLKEAIHMEQEVIKKAGYAVSAILDSPTVNCKSRSTHLQELLDGNSSFVVYMFRLSSCTYVDFHGSLHEVGLKDVDACKLDPISPFSEAIIDGVNRSEARRRALMLFCLVHHKEIAQDSFMLSIDRKGFDVLAKVVPPTLCEGSTEHKWKELRFTFAEDVANIEDFCQLLVEMEEEALKDVKSYMTPPRC